MQKRIMRMTTLSQRHFSKTKLDPARASSSLKLMTQSFQKEPNGNFPWVQTLGFQVQRPNEFRTSQCLSLKAGCEKTRESSYLTTETLRSWTEKRKSSSSLALETPASRLQRQSPMKIKEQIKSIKISKRDGRKT